MKDANNAHCDIGIHTTNKLKVSPSEIVIDGFQPLGAGERWNSKLGQRYVSVSKDSIQSFQHGAAREKGNFRIQFTYVEFELLQ